MDRSAFDRRSLAQAFQVNLNNSLEARTLDTLVSALVEGEQNELLWWMFVRSIHARRHQEEHHMARVQTDLLTGALNGAGFEAWLESRFLGGPQPEAPRVLSVILMDLVNFKKINDTFGYRIGDEIIKEAAVQLAGILRREDDAVVVRFSGDELAVAVADISETASVCILERIHNLQIEKLKYRRNRIVWQRVARAAKNAPAGVEFRVETVDDTSFGDALKKTKKIVYLGGEPVVELGDLLIISSGLQRGIVRSKQDCTRLMNGAEKEMKRLKLQYHKLMGGAYR